MPIRTEWTEMNGIIYLEITTRRNLIALITIFHLSCYQVVERVNLSY